MKKFSYIIKVLVFLVALLGGLASPLKTASAITAGDMWGQTIFGPAYWSVKGPINAYQAWKKILTKPKPTTTPTSTPTTTSTGTTSTGTTSTGTTPTGTTTGTAGTAGTSGGIIPGNPLDLSINSIGDLIRNLTNLALSLAGIVAMIYIVVGAFNYLTAYGNEQKAEAGKNTLMWAIIGLVVIILARLIVGQIFRVITGAPVI